MQPRPEAKTLTRSELYELVWSRPRTALAKELGVSDVAITKHCRVARIPTPAMGYWARLAAGRKAERVALPTRLPGQADKVVIGGDRHAWRWPQEDGLTPEPTPPLFAEDLNAQVASVIRRIGRVTQTRDLSAPDRALAKVLEAEGKRAQATSTYSWQKQRFEQPVFQRQLRLFNSIARALAPLYGPQSVSDGDEWVQGRGTLYHLKLHLNFGGSGMYLRVHEPGEPRRDRAPAPVKITTLRVERGGLDDEPLLEWSDQPGRKLESQLTEIVGGLVRRAEERLRWLEQWYFERQRERRGEELEALGKRRLQSEQQRAKAIEQRKEKMRDEVIGLAERRRRAEDIRAAVAALRSHPDALTPAGSVRFEAWAASALAVAHDIDPMNQPLETLFGLSDDGVESAHLKLS